MRRRFYIMQFLAAFNESFLRMLVIFFLISLQGKDSTLSILINITELTILAFFGFTILGGTLSTYYDKGKILRLSRLFEVGLLLFFLIAFATHSPITTYFLFFLFNVNSALYGPVKYAFFCNLYEKKFGTLFSLTMLGIALGIALSLLLVELTEKYFLLTLFFISILALVEFILSIKFSTKEAKKEIRLSLNPIKELVFSLIEMSRIEELIRLGVSFSYFFFLTTTSYFSLLTFNGFTFQSFLYITLIFLIFGALGAFSTKYKYKENLIEVPCLGLLISLCLMGVGISSHFILLIVMSLLGGRYLTISGESFLKDSPPEDRGKNIASFFFLSLLLILLGGGVAYFLKNHLTPQNHLIVTGCLNLFLSALFFTRLRYRSSRRRMR